MESIGILAGGIAHDFNNLLSVVLSNITLSKLYSNPQDKIYHKLEESEKVIMQSKGLTQKLMTFSRGVSL